MKFFIFFSMCAFILQSSNAAPSKHSRLIKEAETGREIFSTLTDTIRKNNYRDSVSLGASLGTIGLGIEGQVTISQVFRLRAGATVLPLDISGKYMAFPSRAVNVRMNGTMAKVHLFADWKPFAGNDPVVLNKFVLTAGFGYFITAKGTAVMKLKDPYYYGDIELSPDDVGELKAVSKWNGFAPYAGIGMSNLKISNRVNMGISAGVFHLASPSVQLTGSNMLSDNNQNQEQLRRNLDKYYRWLPMLQFSFNYNIKWRKNEK